MAGGVVRAFRFILAVAAVGSAFAQTPRPSAWPFPNSPYYNPTPATSSAWPFITPAATPIAQSASRDSNTAPPARDVPLQEKNWNALANQQVGMIGSKALAIKPEQWKHGETPNFIIHYRRMHEALEVAREIEFDLWNVAQTLGAAPAQYERKSHVFVFKDEVEWKGFLAQTSNPAWSHSFAHRDELFLDVHQQTGAFDSRNLAHETTHAVVARLYARREGPLWLNEGFAEYMGEASVAARHSQNIHRQQQALSLAEMPLAELLATPRYPADRQQVDRLYATSSKLVRYLLNRYPRELFRSLVERVSSGEPAGSALPAVYGAEFADMKAFETKFDRFTR